MGAVAAGGCRGKGADGAVEERYAEHASAAAIHGIPEVEGSCCRAEEVCKTWRRCIEQDAEHEAVTGMGAVAAGGCRGKGADGAVEERYAEDASAAAIHGIVEVEVCYCRAEEVCKAWR